MVNVLSFDVVDYLLEATFVVGHPLLEQGQGVAAQIQLVNELIEALFDFGL